MHIKIKYQILFIAMIPVFIIDASFTYFHINSSINQAEKLLKNKGEIIAQQIAGASEFNLLSGNYEQINHLLDKSMGSNDIIFIAVYDNQGNIISTTESASYNTEQSTEYSYYRQAIQSQSVVYEDIFQPEKKAQAIPLRHLGWVHMYISKDQLRLQKQQILEDATIFFLSMLVIATLLTLSISSRITRPIYILLQYLRQIETGKLGEIINNVESNEIGDMQKGFNSMSQSLLANRMQLDQKVQTATLELMNAITSLEYNNRELAVARDNAQKADQVKTQFLANMSHEIRTPINGIKGFITLLSQTGLNSDQQRYANIITQSTSDLSSIINEILDFSKLESGKVELIEKQFDLYGLVENTRDSLFANILEKNIDLFLTIYSDTPRFLIGDSMRLKQILINLIGNAIKFTDQGFVSIKVFMEDESSEQVMIKFDIEDSGIGITDENQKSLFKAFKQIESDTKRRFSGTGLGLVISKNLTKLMGGEIKLNSNLDSGSLFSVLVPFKHAIKEISTSDDIESKSVFILASDKHALSEIRSLFNRINYSTEAELIDEATNAEDLQSRLLQNLRYIDLVVIDLRHNRIHPEEFIPPQIHEHCEVIIMHYDVTMIDSSKYTDYRFISVINSSNSLLHLLTNQPQQLTETSKVPQQSKALHAKEILIVDDNFINLALATELARLWGHDPKEASNAQQAMELFRTLKFDLILLDIQMPEVDGIELMTMMREEQPELKTPIVAITANALDTEQERLLNMGFDGYLSKPIDETKLKNLLQHEKPLVVLASEQLPTGNQELSIDFELTFNLSAKNQILVDATFHMLELEIPDYLDDLIKAIQTKKQSKISAIMHKLQGVTCYVGLPRLKKLLTEYQTMSHLDKGDLLEFPRQIEQELTKIDSELKSYQKSKN